jgi:hypothetical protein
MSIEFYNKMKEKFNNTKPIRGRAVETKPIADRRRCWETVVKVWVVPNGALDAEGIECYGAHLYNTDCVLYAPNGDIYLQSNGYSTPTTSEFMTRYLPYQLRTYKKYNKLWVDGTKVGAMNGGEFKSGAFVLNNKEKTVLKYNPTQDNYTIENPVKVVQRVIDRTKAKDARAKVKDFKAFAKAMLSIADGWLTEDLLKVHTEPKKDGHSWGGEIFALGENRFNSYHISGRVNQKTAQTIYEAMQTDDDQLKVKLMCMIATTTNHTEARNIRTETYETEWNGTKRMHERIIREYRYNPDSVARRIDKIVEYACDIHTTKEVEQGKVMTNLV